MKSKRKKTKSVLMFLLNDFVADKRVLKLAKTLGKNNYKVKIVATHFDKSLPKEEVIDENVTCTRIRISKIPFLMYLEFWIKNIVIFLKHKPDIIVCHDLNTLPIGTFLKSKHQNIKLLYDTHEFFPSMIEESKGRAFFWIFASLEKPLIKKADYITTISQSMAFYIRKYYSLKKKVDYIFNAPNESITSLPVKEVEREENEIIFVNVGYISAINRGFELLPAFATHLKQLRRQSDPKIKLLIIGDGSFRETIQARIHSQGHSDIISFLGYFPYDEAMSITKSCDVGVILTQATSLNNLYSGPNRIFDYLGNYLPLLVTNLYEFKRIASGKNCGWVIPTNDPRKFAETVLEIARDKSAIMEKKENVKKLFHKYYTWEKMEDKILSIYGNL